MDAEQADHLKETAAKLRTIVDDHERALAVAKALAGDDDDDELAALEEAEPAEPASDEPRPEPVIVAMVCSICNLPWEEHCEDPSDQPTLMDCIRLLKARPVVGGKTVPMTTSGTHILDLTSPTIYRSSATGGKITYGGVYPPDDPQPGDMWVPKDPS